MKYLIYSHRHNNHGRDGVATFWRPNQCGYTADIDRAGRYSEEEALRIVGDGETTAMIPENAFDDQGAFIIERIIRTEVGDNAEKLRAFH